jgi:hypothetical protein
MADSSMVALAIAVKISAILFPSSAFIPVAAEMSAVVGSSVRIYRGWPMQKQLTDDAQAGVTSISVIEAVGMVHNTTRWQYGVTTPLPEMTLYATLQTISGVQATTLSGTPVAGYLIAVELGGDNYVYTVTSTDTLGTILIALTSLIPGTTTDGISTLYFASQPVCRQVRVGQIATVQRVVRQQTQSFKINVWAPNPGLRDLVTSTIDAVLADTPFLFLSDGTGGRLLYGSNLVVDVSENAGIYRRELTYSVDYPTTRTEKDTTLVVGISQIEMEA